VKLSLSLSEASRPAWLDEKLADTLRRIAESIEQTTSPVDVILVDDRYIKKINREFRGIDRTTDVISFSYLDDLENSPAEEDLAGEVFVSYETLEREASSQGLDVRHLFLRIGVHGLLHVVGYDHQSDSDSRKMEDEEKRLLRDEMSSSDVAALF
jgi:probable rRNA maturation factor